MSKIDSEKVKEFLSSGARTLAAYALDAYENRLDEEGSNAFADAIEIGIANTVAALYEANVEDNEIIRVLNLIWGINEDEATDRLVFEKTQALLRELKDYLRLQGMSSKDILNFMRSNKVSMKLRHNPDLRALRRKPEKLMKAVQE